MGFLLNFAAMAVLAGLLPLFQLPKAGVKATTPMAAPKAEVPPAKVAQPTNAERITNARQSIERGLKTIEKLQQQLDDPDADYRKAEQEFEASDLKLKEARKDVARLRKDGRGPMADELERGIPKLTEDRELTRERFDIAIRKMKATRESIANLKERVAADQESLNALEGKTPPAAVPPTAPVAAVNPPPAVAPPAAPKPAAPAVDKPAAAPAIPAIPLPGIPVLPSASASAPAPSPAATAEPVAALRADDPEVRKAQVEVEAARVRLREAEARTRVAEERVRTMERSIKGIVQMAQIERDAAAQAEKAAAKHAEELEKNPPADPVEKDTLAERRVEAEKRATEARERAQRLVDRAAVQNETLRGLKDDLEVAQAEVEAQKRAVASAETAVSDLTSPLATRNLFRWAREHGPALIAIILGTLLLHFLVRQFSRHIVQFVARNSRRGSPEDRENRASTLVGVFRYAGGLAIFGGGLVMALDESGVPIVPLMGGAAVLGLAVAFGAQNLIRDYFCGFMMLLEDQYSVNDVVRIGPIAGLVEQITLRVTVLRDLEGVRHFIPHGSITSVSNLTHGWSRAMVEVSVAYKEDVDRVMAELVELGKDMQLHPKLGRHILEEPEMLGVDSLSDSGVTIKFLIKTRPLQQWPIKRELLRRIKNRFDELGIEIPFPHRTVYHRGLNDAGAANLSIHMGEPSRMAG